MAGNEKAQAAMAATVAQLVELMEQGAGEWRMPWNAASEAWRPSNPVTGRRYTGGNRVHLALMSMMAGTSSRWATYRQWQEIGAQVRKGERSTAILRPIFRKVVDAETGDETQRLVSWATVAVFAADQVDGWTPTVAEPLAEDRHDGGERFVAALVAGGLDLVHGGECAYYSPCVDRVTVPAFAQFTSAAGYYSTVLHEATHWTGHESRLNRLVKLAKFGDDAYAAEELVAELGSAFLCCDLGIESLARTDHAAYLASWIRVLRADPKHLWMVASKAEDATAFLMRTADAVLPRDDGGAGSPSDESVPSDRESTALVVA